MKTTLIYANAATVGMTVLNAEQQPVDITAVQTKDGMLYLSYSDGSGMSVLSDRAFKCPILRVVE